VLGAMLGVFTYRSLSAETWSLVNEMSFSAIVAALTLHVRLVDGKEAGE